VTVHAGRRLEDLPAASDGGTRDVPIYQHFVEQAKKLVALANFNKCEADEAKIEFLYQRVYQRPPRPEEVKLGIEFVTEKPETDNLAATEALQQVSNDSETRKKFKEKQGKKRPSRAPNDFKKREPLKVWEEYTHALMQANEASFKSGDTEIPAHPIFYGYAQKTIPVRYANGPLLTVPERVRSSEDPWHDIDADLQSLEPFLEMHERDRANGLHDAPWPPVYPKQPDEPPRVAPSRAKKA